MAEIVNLRRVRKDKARHDRDAQADANRRRFGRTKAEKAADADARRRAEDVHDGRRLEPGKQD